MNILILYFILHGGKGFIEPLYITAAACGKPFVVAGLQVDREKNPTVARWADCEVDISAKLATLPVGTYELAATGNNHYDAPDPHTSITWVKDLTGISRPTKLRIKP